MEYAVEVVDLYKSYGKTVALNGLTLRVRPGEIYGLIGPNGAGKTTTLKILCGLLKPDKGIVRIYGYDVVRERLNALRLVGYVPENPVVFQNLSVEEFIRFIIALRGISQEEVSSKLSYYLEVFDLKDKKHKLMGELSRGMIQKVLVTTAFLVKPKVLVMDEPMAGMDPSSQHVFKREVKRLAAQGVAVIISSHLLDVVERFCTRIGIIHKGRMVLEGSVDEVKNYAMGKRRGSLEEVFLEIIGRGGKRSAPRE